MAYGSLLAEMQTWFEVMQPARLVGSPAQHTSIIS